MNIILNNGSRASGRWTFTLRVLESQWRQGNSTTLVTPLLSPATTPPPDPQENGGQESLPHSPTAVDVPKRASPGGYARTGTHEQDSHVR